MNDQHSDEHQHPGEVKSERSDLNFIKRYTAWAGKRSIIFQVILVGWTAFAFLGTCGMMFTTLGEQNENVAAAAFSMFSCCGCGGYLLIAIPLAFAAIATLEGDVKIKKSKEE